MEEEQVEGFVDSEHAVARAAETEPAPKSLAVYGHREPNRPCHYFAEYKGVSVDPIELRRRLDARNIKYVGITFSRDPDHPVTRIALRRTPTEDEKDLIDRAMRDAYRVEAKHQGIEEWYRPLRDRKLFGMTTK